MKRSMKLTGVEVPAETLFKLEPNTFLAVVSDKDGNVRVIEVEARDDVTHSTPADTILCVAGASTPPSDTVSSMAKGGSARRCLICLEGTWTWKDC